ncbi:MAG: hypothetical protein NC117_03675 [Pseudoflavonifractor sp.]|nr:hypothetical protein [Pseudoflavonifractor sp.]
MATPIKQVPILTGKLAEAFVREAEENEKLPRFRLPHEREERVRKVMRQLQEFRFPWDKEQR